MSLGLYLHIPYCFSKCRYCDFYSHPGERGVPDAYVDALLRELLAAEGLLIKNHVDCGCILFDANEQSVKSGGSGPGCCAAVLCGHILPRLERGSHCLLYTSPSPRD